jgi:membrane protein DedA with SNARE-associated domain
MPLIPHLPELFSLDDIQFLAHQYGYWVVFVGIMLENAGLPLPGETITLVGGFLAGSGELGYSGVLASAIGGAVIGDNIGYWLGFYGGWALLLSIGKLFKIEESKLAKVRDEFRQSAGKAVILGRFVALLRIFAGPLAGIAKMPYWQFLLCNLLGATLWAAIMVTLAFFVGRVIPLEVLVGWVARFAVLALALVFAAITWKVYGRRALGHPQP